jgi:hypothetical protein
MGWALGEGEHDDLFADKHTGTGESSDSLALTTTGPFSLPDPEPEQPVVLL